jgi:hypothetical protein
MKLWSKSLLAKQTKIKTNKYMFYKLGVARSLITEPQIQNSNDENVALQFDIIKANGNHATSGGYIYLYPTKEYQEIFATGSIRLAGDLAVQPYSSSNLRTAIGGVATSVPTGVYNFYVETLTGDILYEFQLDWTAYKDL